MNVHQYHVKIMQFGGILGFAYITWSIGQFFDKTKITSYIKSFFAYVLGSISFLLAIVIIGTAIDYLK